MSDKAEKPLWKRWWVWTIGIILFISFLRYTLGLAGLALLGWGIYRMARDKKFAWKPFALSLAGCLIGLFGIAAATSNGTPISSTQQQPAAQVAAPTPKAAKPIINARKVTVSKVIDGDTIELTGGEKVRLIGVNTPETVKPDTPVQPYGKEASNFTKSQLEGKTVFLETDVQTKDKYGRTLAYIYLQEPKTQADIEKYMFNAILLREGYAQVMTIPPNVKYQDLFVKLQRQAREQNKGLWALHIYKDSVTSTDDVFLEGKDPTKQTQTSQSKSVASSASNASASSQAAVAAPQQASGVQIISVSSPVARGSYATLTAKVTPGATAYIEVDYKSGPSKASGLGPKEAGPDGTVSWTWKVGTKTTPGTWPITVTCNGASASTSFEVIE